MELVKYLGLSLCFILSVSLLAEGGKGGSGPPQWVQELIAAKSGGVPWEEPSTKGPIVVYSAAVIPREPAPPTPFWNKWKYGGSGGSPPPWANGKPKYGYRKKQPNNNY